MEKENSNRTATGSKQGPLNNCNVNSTFNFTVGAIAIVVAGIIGYFVYQYFMK